MSATVTRRTASDCASEIAAARAEERAGRWSEARGIYEQLLNDAAMPLPLRSSVLNWVGRSYLAQGSPERAMAIFNDALKVAERAADSGAEASALNWIAIAEQGMGNLDASEAIYERARQKAAVARDDLLIAMIDQNVGTIANIRGDLGRALQSYDRSLERYRALGEREHEASVLNNIGMLYTDLGEWDRAEETYVRAHAVATDDGDVRHEHRIEVNQVELWIARGDLAKARSSCERLMTEAESDPNAPWVGDVYKHYAVICRMESDLHRADVFLLRAAKVASKSHDLLLAAETAREQAELFWLQARNSDTLQALNRAHGWFSQLRAERDLAAIERRNSRLEERFLEVVEEVGRVDREQGLLHSRALRSRRRSRLRARTPSRVRREDAVLVPDRRAAS